MKAFSYHCPFCNQHATITEENFSVDNHAFYNNNKYGRQSFISNVIVCPNPDCKEYSLIASLHDQKYDGKQYVISTLRQTWQLIPASNAKILPDYIPLPIIQDYNEACAISVLSPKASATLARRCLQGIIRDFWGIVKPRLIDEIEAIQDRVDPLTWSAIDAVRRIGNIGAHMEKDINIIIDVDPEEALLLIGLIETVIQDWYIARHEREQRLRKLITVSQEKTTSRDQIKTANQNEASNIDEKEHTEGEDIIT